MKPKVLILVVCIIAIDAVVLLSWWWWKERASRSTARELQPATNAVAVTAELPNDTALQPAPSPDAPPQEEIVGIGAILRVDNESGALLITGAVPNSPAAEAGLSGNFTIRKIDDVSAEGMKLAEAVNRLRGTAGTKVRLELFDVDANEPRTVELTRRRIQVGESRRVYPLPPR